MIVDPRSDYMMKRKLVTLAVFILALILVSVGGDLQNSVRAQQPNRVGLVVDFGDHHETYCVEFSESQITGYDALRRAGLNLVVAGSGGMGFAVCDINGTSGCSASNCFCQCQGGTCTYWSYHHLVNGSWQYSQMGASGYQIHNGDVEGWGWGEGQINASGAEPPVIPFDQICAPPATDTPVPTNTPIPPTNTPLPPTDTPPPTPIPTPEVWFRLDENPIAAGSCTMLRWDTSNAQEVYLDSEVVALIGSHKVCPTATTDYELRVIGLEGEETFRLTLGVTGSAATPTSTPQANAVPPSPTLETDATTAPPSPTQQATKRSSLSPTATGSTTPPSSTTAQPTVTRTKRAATTASPSPSATSAQIAQAKPTVTHRQVAEVEDAEERTINGVEDEAAKSPEDGSSSPLTPIGTVAFSLIVGGLLGWLIYILRFRGRRA